MRRAFAWICVVVAALLAVVATARAEDVRRAGTVRLEATPGGRGPLILVPTNEGFTGELGIVNEGKEPLVVSRIAVRGDSDSPRVPPKLTVRLADGTLPVTIPPGGWKKAVVQWSPERNVRQRQVFAHVIVTSSDEQSGEVAMGIRAQRPGPLGWLEGSLLTMLVAMPLVGAIATFLLRAMGRRDGRAEHAASVIALAAQVALAIYVYRGFAPDVSRLDGNDGLQYVEHAVWIRSLAAELFLGVDGIAAACVVLVSLVSLLAILPDGARKVPGFYPAFLVLEASLMGALVAMDGLLFVLFTSVAVIASAILVAGAGGPERQRAATRLAAVGGFAVILLLLATVAVARNADPTFLVDGSKTTTTFNLAELSRVSLGAKGATILGASLVKVAFVFVLVSSMVLLGIFPFHGTLTGAIFAADTAAGVLVSTALPVIGACLLLRIGCTVLPEGMRWASGVVVALGAVSAAYGALGAFAEGDLRRVAAFATTSQAGFVLLGAGTLSAQGMAGAIVVAAMRPLACGAFLMLAGAVDERVRTRDTARLSGVGAEMPGFAVVLAIAALAQAGVLGLGTSWGPMLGLFGAMPSYAPLALVAAFALVVGSAAHLRAVGRIAFGVLDPAWRRDPALAPHGGKFVDLTSREWLGVAPLATLIVVLGFWPAPIIGVTSGTVRDLTFAVSPTGPDRIALR